MNPPNSLSALQRNKIRRLAVGEPPPTAEGSGELNIVPFLDIITNVLMFVLATIAITFTATIDTTPARRHGVRPPTEPALDLTVLVVDGGFGLKARGGNVSPGCTDVGPGLAVPKRDASFDYEALRECVSKIKGSAAQPESGVTITASPQIPYDVVIATTDALRTSTAGEPLFPDVTFAVVR